jgi:hypothetical protein
MKELVYSGTTKASLRKEAHEAAIAFVRDVERHGMPDKRLHMLVTQIKKIAKG